MYFFWSDIAGDYLKRDSFLVWVENGERADAGKDEGLEDLRPGRRRVHQAHARVLQRVLQFIKKLTKFSKTDYYHFLNSAEMQFTTK